LEYWKGGAVGSRQCAVSSMQWAVGTGGRRHRSSEQYAVSSWQGE